MELRGLNGLSLPLTEQVALSRKANEGYVFEGQMITAKGNKNWVRIAGHVELHHGVPVRRFGMKQDITEEKQALEQIKRLAERDPLTGLRNRAQSMARLSDARDRGSQVSLMLLELDGFKDIKELGQTEPTVGEPQEMVDSIYRLQEELLAMRHHLLTTRSRLETTKTEVARLLGRADV